MNETAPESILIFISFFSAFSCMLAFGVAYNASRVALSERARELATLRGMMLDTFRDIRERTVAALGEVEAVIESGAASEPDRVVIVDEAAETSSAGAPPVPRPDL